MALIIEDGSIVENANSFVDLDFIRNFAAQSGDTVSDDDDTLSGQAVKAFRFINGRENQMQGERVSADQTGCYPRECVTLYGKFDVASDAIPLQLKQAQAQLCIEQENGVDIEPTATEAALTRKKIGPLEWEWDAGAATNSPDMPKVDAFLEPLFKRGGFTLMTRRA